MEKSDIIDCEPTDVWREFIIGAGKVGITYDDLMANWRYAGGDWGCHDNYYRMAYSHLPRPEVTSYCLCRTQIKHNAYITNKEYIVVAGSCCITHFMPNGMSRTCEMCDRPHRNRKDNKCNDCRKKIRKCLDCKTVIDKTFTRCYKCHMNRVITGKYNR